MYIKNDPATMLAEKKKKSFLSFLSLRAAARSCLKNCAFWWKLWEVWNCNLMKFVGDGSNLVKVVEVFGHLELQSDEI